MFKSARRSTFSDFLIVLFFESCHAIGLAILIFVVFPELDVVKGAMLTNCVAFIPALLSKKLFIFVCLVYELYFAILYLLVSCKTGQ